MRPAAIALCLLAGLLGPTPSRCAQLADKDLLSASLEELTQIQVSVSSFARKDEDLWKTPAAVFVITREDIARSAVSSVPELLRIVPGMQVAQINASTWAISVRGFNSIYASKLLVLIDGRTLYSESSAGVRWDEIDQPLDDIERIEVIRGPGAAVWGTNAVNGVINIITKKARNSMGLSVASSVSRIGETADVRFGGTLSPRMHYRAFASYINRSPFELASGQRAFDGEDTVRGGGRFDWQKTGADWITMNGDLYGGHPKEHVLDALALDFGPAHEEYESIAGGHILSRWEHKFEKSDMALQFYYDDESRHELTTYTRTRTLDLDYQDHKAAGSRHDLVWGAEVRLTADHYSAPVPTFALPEYKNYLVDGFVQDEIALVANRLTLTVGSKIQSGTLAGLQVQPSARILWAPDRRQSLWAAVSRAAVAPSIEDKALSVPLFAGFAGSLPIIAELYGSANFKPETLAADELGYRRRFGSSLTLDLAGFINNNFGIQSLTTGAFSFDPAPTPHLAGQLLFSNGFRARTGGIESAATWKPTPKLSLQASYAWMQARLTQTDPGIVRIADAWGTPRNIVSGTAFWNFATRWSANTFISHVGIIPIADTGGSITPAYTRVDLHLSHRVGRSLLLDAGGTNLVTPRHSEFSSTTGFVVPAEVPRSAFIKAAWSF